MQRLQLLLLHTLLFALLFSCASPPEYQLDQRMVRLLPVSDASVAYDDYSVREGSMASVWNGRVDWELYEPELDTGSVPVVIGHGFMRSLERMRGWAELLASRGIPATVISFSNSSWFGGNHDRNADDMRLVANTLFGGTRAYMGFSAGGLSALLAAAADPLAWAYVGLDPVDSGGLAAAAIATLRTRNIHHEVLLAEPSACNAQSNMLDALSTVGLSFVMVDGSTHCHFEHPYDPNCEALCGRSVPSELQDVLVARIRAYVVQIFGQWNRENDLS